MAWHHPGDKPLSEPMMVWFTEANAKLGLSDLVYIQLYSIPFDVFFIKSTVAAAKILPDKSFS